MFFYEVKQVCSINTFYGNLSVSIFQASRMFCLYTLCNDTIKKDIFKDKLRAHWENLKLSKWLLNQIKFERKNCPSVVKSIVILCSFKYICKY